MTNIVTDLKGRRSLVTGAARGIGQAIAVALVLGALGGLYLAWRATKLRPVEALRYE